MRLIAYIRVSTEHQSDSGLGLAAQEATVRAYAAQSGHEIVGLVVEVASGGKCDRPLLSGVLEALKRGEADGLVVSKLWTTQGQKSCVLVIEIGTAAPAPSG